MQPIQINVQINIGLNSELFTLLSSVVNRPAKFAELPEVKGSAKPQPALRTADDQNATTATEAQSPTEETKPGAAPEPQSQEQAQQETKECTEVDVRAAMDRTRKRIEGENYKENPDSEGYKKWHRALTGWFKNTAAIFGAEKPSALADSESRAKFIACCDAVQVKGDELVEDYPF